MITLVLNTIGSYTLFQFMSYVGIALATACASWLNVALLTITLYRRGHLKPDDKLKRNAPRALLCSLLMGGALMGGAWLLGGALSGHVLIKTLALSALVAGGIALFFALAIVTGTIAAGELKRMLRLS